MEKHMSSVTQLKSKRQKTKTAFQELIEERIELTRELKKFDSVRYLKLTPEAFVRESIEVARSSTERLKKLRAALESPDRPELDHSRTTLRAMISGIRSPNWSGPPRDLRRLSYFLEKDGIALAELSASGNNLFELFACAAWICAEKYPDAFGVSESTRGTERKIQVLSVRRDELDKRLSSCDIPAEEIINDEPDREGRVKPMFKLGGGKVPVYPRENCGERLANHLAQQELTHHG